MRAFHFKAEYQKLLTPEVVAYLTQIHEYKGQQNLFIEAEADTLSSLLEVARIQSTEASNRIEGIITTDDRLKKIVREKTMPQTRSEKEIAGYRDMLATIHESHDYIPPKPTVILQLHRDELHRRNPHQEQATNAQLREIAETMQLPDNLPGRETYFPYLHAFQSHP